MTKTQSPRPPQFPSKRSLAYLLLLFLLFTMMNLLNSRGVFFALGGANHPFLPIVVLGTLQLVALVAVLIYLGRHRGLRSQRLHHNQCVQCGFDLRASIDRCPECGTPFDTSRVNKRHPGEFTPRPKIDRRTKGSSPISAAKPMPHDHPQADGRS